MPMPDHEIPTLDTILNEPNIDSRMNYLIGIAYTNYDSINNIQEKIEEICKERATGLTPKERWSIISAFLVSVAASIGLSFR
jgi:hypothetical protein